MNKANVVRLGDDGYGIKPCLTTPFRNPTPGAEINYNKLLKQERVIIERCFDQLKRRFPIQHVLHNVAKSLGDPDFELVELEADEDEGNHENDELPLHQLGFDQYRFPNKERETIPGEGGIILLTSVIDSFRDDEEEEILRSLECPPSPCDVSFINDNILIDGSKTYKVPSATKSVEYYYIDGNIGVCTCHDGKLGKFCKHQAAIYFYFEETVINAPTVTPESRYEMAKLAFGEKLKISFVDGPEIYEYPSETSLLVEESIVSPVGRSGSVPSLSVHKYFINCPKIPKRSSALDKNIAWIKIKWRCVGNL
ncbi:unnamed protein product [Acanthoscelides obtectus]|uniref:SWIM-type domain-containing protein n=1 Tax=Acanthoscelides obtectus TaxID=200917 RepID=A0A9P0P8S8_ACAOB|nr:unnamed protein product [Acanthoscelides obtectus]CAK1665321.1 hypothetical protein AOBTE_LOCUS24758 [Acanthoscelides obtectus]